MANYYYAVAALPSLRFDMEEPPTDEAFVEFCVDQCTPHDTRLVAEARFGSENVDHPTLCDVEGFERALRRALAEHRAATLGWELGDDPRRNDPQVSRFAVTAHAIVQDAMAKENPFERERALDRARFTFLEELQVGHYFDVVVLMLYRLKLALIRRSQARTADKGEEVFRADEQSVWNEIEQGLEWR